MKLLPHTEHHPIMSWASDLEAEAEAQVRNLATLPFIHDHVAVMPDAHAGKGSTVGTVIATRGAIIPAAVGVDIGCGMMATQLPFGIDRWSGDGQMAALRHDLERLVPTGFHANKKVDPAWERMTRYAGGVPEGAKAEKVALQLGSLGGGNQFIELCADEAGAAWVVLHSGSRNVGKTLAERHIRGAQDLMRRYLIELPDPDLAYFLEGSPAFAAYLRDLDWCQMYARVNREVMMGRVLRSVATSAGYPEGGVSRRTINCHHNYTNLENHFGAAVYVTRKGAVSARRGEWGIIPGSMGTKSYIVQGKGNASSFCSCSHGAGRRMSRGAARRRFTVADLARQTDGVECRKDAAVLDEIPASYKDIDQVMAAQADLVEIRHTLKQVLCVKGG